MKLKSRNQCRSRRGAVAVEFAFVAPVFVVIIVGLGLASRLTELQNHFSTAAHEGGRLGASDRALLSDDRSSTNDLVEQEVLSLLEAQGIDSEHVDVTVTHVDEEEAAFDLDSPANSNKLFRVRVEVPYDEAGSSPFPGSSDYMLRGEAVFRNAEITYEP